MQQKNIREFNGQQYTTQEAAEWLKELDDRTKSNENGYNSVGELVGKVKETEDNIDEISEVKSISTNLLNKDLFVLDEAYDNVDGTIFASAGRGRTHKLDCLPGQNYTFTGGKADYLYALFWDSTDNFLSSVNLSSGIDTTFTPIANAAKMAFNFANSDASDYVDTLQLNEGDQVLPYESYNNLSRKIKKSALPKYIGGEAYDQTLNTTDSVEFASVRVSGLELDLPTSSSGLAAGQAWVDTSAGNVIKIV
ncbi:hypothetical protein [Mesonia sp. HuA40]|uniref:hypothetical protein n=1 Tax=Mesonia sp. HuA40 TaxID=2602761 RepID=UPI0011CA171C|nr:hypothetical protein [Mesonia sp. HuA40]TXK73953.1 hypothetical protein FT993_03585 [Mesonia sp. HuA40]